MGPLTKKTEGHLALWQWVVLALPIVSIVAFVLISAGVQIHAWGVSWIWAIMTIVFVGWRWLVVKWTQPLLKQLSGAIVDLQTELDTTLAERSTMAADADIVRNADQAVRQILDAAEDDLPIWEDWPTFWQRCQEVVSAIAHLYHPEVKYPLLNIHIPQAYGLIRGTVDDMDVWMQKLSPVLNQVSVGQAYQAYEVYRKLEPSARKLGKVWNWARWLWNPAAAAAQTASQPYNNQATQQLLVNLSQSLREVALHTLGQQAIALYSGKSGKTTTPAASLDPTLHGTIGQSSPQSKTSPQSSHPTIPSQRNVSPAKPTSRQPLSSPAVEPKPLEVSGVPVVETVVDVSASSSTPQSESIRSLLEQANPAQVVAQESVKLLLVGRTGAGKSSVINTIFQTKTADVDVLPSTDRIQEYRWLNTDVSPSQQAPEEAQIILWDTPGYEQTDREEFRQQVLAKAQEADVIVLVTPAMDPALQMDADFLRDLQAEQIEVPVFVVVTQVDRVRPVREWSPPYDWQWGEGAKERSMRDAIAYRREALEDLCNQLLPLVTLELGADGQPKRQAWNGEQVVELMVNAIAPAKQLRLARFLRTQDLQAQAAAQIIKGYTVQMTTTQGITALVKSPILKFLSTLTTGSPDLAYLLEEQIPIEQLPLVIGKLQMAYDLFNALPVDDAQSFNVLSLWPLLLENEGSPRENAEMFGHAIAKHFIQATSVDDLHRQFYQSLARLSLKQQT